MYYSEEDNMYYKSGTHPVSQWPSSWRKTLTDGRPNVGTPWGHNCSAQLWSSYLELHFAQPVTLLPGKYVAYSTRIYGNRWSGSRQYVPVEDQVFGSFEKFHTDDVLLRDSSGDLAISPVYYNTYFPGTHGTDRWDLSLTAQQRRPSRGRVNPQSIPGNGWWAATSRDPRDGAIYFHPIGHGRITDGIVPERIEGIYRMVVQPHTSGVTQLDFENILFTMPQIIK